MKLPKKRLVAVRWEDAYGDLNRRPKGHHCFNTTVGWLLNENKDGLLELANEWSAEGTRWRGMTYVPVANVVSIVDLRPQGV
jgi:hypothetical protein